MATTVEFECLRQIHAVPPPPRPLHGESSSPESFTDVDRAGGSKCRRPT